MERGSSPPTLQEGARATARIVVLPSRTTVPGGEPMLVATAFDAAYRAHAGEIHAYLLHCTRDAGIAEDLTQEAFLRLCRELRAGRVPTNLRAWLYRVAGNLAASRGRRLDVARRWLDGVALDEEGLDAEEPEPAALLRDRHVRLESALAELPRDARVALLMAATGFSGREISLALGRSEVATRTLLFRARLRLRSRLVDEEFGPDDAPARADGSRRPGSARRARAAASA